MEYEQFERDFIQRTQRLLQQYDDHVMPAVPASEQHETTLLVNCLLGLLVLPRELAYDRIPKVTPNRFSDWGLTPNAVESWGRCGSRRQDNQGTLPDLLRHMRNAVCHLRIETTPQDGQIAELVFEDWHGFRCRVDKSSLRRFVERLAQAIST